MKKSLFALLTLSMTATAALAEVPVVNLTIKDHKFEPATLEIPANQKVKLLVKNADSTAEEFESHDFNREKVIAGNSEAPILVGPLKPGEYKFFGEFHPETAQGKLIVK
jgi:plastocyanin